MDTEIFRFESYSTISATNHRYVPVKVSIDTNSFLPQTLDCSSKRLRYSPNTGSERQQPSDASLALCSCLLNLLSTLR